MRILRNFPLPAITRPIFVIGTVRSGKSSLARCLGRHPQIFYAGCELTSEWRDFAGIEIARSHTGEGGCPPYAREHATEARRDRARRSFAAFLALRAGRRSPRLLDDNPHLWNKLAFVRAIFPDAQLVVASRDLRSTVASMKLLWINGRKRWGTRYHFPQEPEHCWGVLSPASPVEAEDARVFPGGDVAVLAEYWLNTHRMIEGTLEGFESPILVRQRDFLARPEETLARIHRAMDLPLLEAPAPSLPEMPQEADGSGILTPEEHERLDVFVEENRPRIERLTFADTTL